MRQIVVKVTGKARSCTTSNGSPEALIASSRVAISSRTISVHRVTARGVNQRAWARRSRVCWGASAPSALSWSQATGPKSSSATPSVFLQRIVLISSNAVMA
jgi:hypothetical protein